MLWTPKDDRDALRELERIHHQNMIKAERELVRASLEEVNRREQRARIEDHIETIIQKAKGDHEDQPEEERETVQPIAKRRKRRNPKKTRR